ncbi:MAG: 6-phosphogluconolactonase [Bacteroidetes bacterium]|nr:6-phosphogluconolactonase [Bacteroidota bacterium]
MHITNCATVAELNELAANAIIKDLNSRPASLFCAATGNSPTGIYQLMVQRKSEFNAGAITLLKLDEWCGLPMDFPATCEQYLQRNLIKPLGITSFTGFDSSAADPGAECQRIQNFLDEHQPIDLCVLGLGQNGHIAFNEPAGRLEPNVHLSPLTETSLNHSMIKGSGYTLKYGYTLGMADILKSRKIILPVFGKNKRDIWAHFLEGKISTQLPASFLWLHPDVECFYCENDS